MKKIMKILTVLIIVACFVPADMFGQAPEPSKNQLETILSKFINYRFGTISILRIKNPADIKKALRARDEAESGVKIDDAVLKTVDANVLSIIENGVKAGDQLDQIRQDINAAGLNPPDKTILESIYNFYKSRGQNTQQYENAYLITTRPERGQIPSTIIALLVTTRAGDDIAKNLKFVGNNDILTYDELKAFKLDSSFTTADNMYDLMVNALIQMNYENKTMDAQGIGNPEWFAPKQHGKTETLISTESDISSNDIQKFIRISDPQPNDLKLKQNEIVLSPDLISWRKYSLPMWDNGGKWEPDSMSSSNVALPDVGVELRYGIEDINYPSLWSERMTLSAIWQSGKLGVILPTAGWSTITKDVFNVDRKLTHAGVGLAAAFDFPIKVIPKSGVFHLSMGYVFGNAIESDYKNRKIANPNLDENYEKVIYPRITDKDEPLYIDYLIRGNAQLHYTFGVQIDSDYWLRFGIGGTVYNVERWLNKVSVTSDTLLGITNKKLEYVKYNDETKGGISGKIEFMARNISTPFGASIQYFDEAISADAWLQIPIVENIIAVRLDAKGYFIAFRSTPNPWEASSVVIPMARFIVNF